MEWQILLHRVIVPLSVVAILVAAFLVWREDKKVIDAAASEAEKKRLSDVAAEQKSTLDWLVKSRVKLSHVRWERDRFHRELDDALARLADRSGLIDAEKVKATEIRLSREREDAKDAVEKEKARRENLVVYAKSVDNGKHPLYALMLAKAHELPTNDALLAFIDDITTKGHEHPFHANFSAQTVPESKYLELLRDARSKGCEFKTHDEFVSYGSKTRNQDWDKCFGNESKQKPF